MGETLFLYDSGHLARQFPLGDLASWYGNQRLETLILHVEMGWWVIIMPHPHDNTEEYRQNGHGQLFLERMELGLASWSDPLPSALFLMSKIDNTMGH